MIFERVAQQNALRLSHLPFFQTGIGTRAEQFFRSETKPMKIPYAEQIFFFVSLWGLLSLPFISRQRGKPLGVFLVTAAAAFAVTVAFHAWLARRARRWATPLKTYHHSDLGEVLVFSDRWEAWTGGAPGAGRIKLAGPSENDGPSEQQIRISTEITQRFEMLVKEGRHALSSYLAKAKPPFKPEDLTLADIWIEEEQDRIYFSFYFEVPGRIDDEGLYVDFADFAVAEAGSVH
jgi:hypothetical protein